MATAQQNTATATQPSACCLTLVMKKEEAPGVVSFVFSSIELTTWRAGQYLHYYLKHEADNRGQDRYFTISSAPYEQVVMLTTRFSEKSSSFKKALRELQPGQTIYADELGGDFVVEDPNQEMIFIAGGIGITPYRSIVLDLAHRGLPVKATLFYSGRDGNFPFVKELERLARVYLTFNIHYVISPKRIGEDDLLRAASSVQPPVYYVSGPEPMVESYAAMLQEMGVADSHIKLDYFPGYAWP
jgi:glycine betaine catabolism B